MEHNKNEIADKRVNYSNSTSTILFPLPAGIIAANKPKEFISVVRSDTEWYAFSRGVKIKMSDSPEKSPYDSRCRACVLLFEYVPGARVNTDNYIFSLWSWDRARPQREPRRIIPALHIGWLRKRGLTCGRSDYAMTEAHEGHGMARWWHNWYHSGVFFWGDPSYSPITSRHDHACLVLRAVMCPQVDYTRGSPSPFPARPTRGNDTYREEWPVCSPNECHRSVLFFVLYTEKKNICCLENIFILT